MQFQSFTFLGGMRMKASWHQPHGRPTPGAHRGLTRAQVAASLLLLALGVMAGGSDAAGQSAVTLGSALDQPPAGDSLLSSGSFRLDSPAEPAAPGESSGDPHSGATSLGLQIYSSGFGSGPRPVESDSAPPPLGSLLTRP